MSEIAAIGFWKDPLVRSGPENMAVDSWLLERGEPVLRVYGWKGDWCSMGYFGSVDEARAVVPGPSLVRRATGGGFVDHRNDLTYTIVVPRTSRLAGLKGSGSYRVVHEALAEAMKEAGMVVGIVKEDAPVRSPVCFQKPVAWDILDEAGRKVAGAGQRRTRSGLLHQGSVMCRQGVDGDTVMRSLARRLARKVEDVCCEPSGESFAALIDQFACPSWLERR
ncbi:MAG: hypothetical protein VX633_13120 [Verrucomicrobiota bacterium]|nr:hypothetical protein [Verrucomicrobiota bacterium]